MNKAGSIRAAAYCVMTLLFWFANYAFLPYLPSYAGAVTNSTLLVGVMMGAYGWMQVTLRVPIGILADRLDNRRAFVRMGCIITFIATLGFYFAPNIYLMIFCRALCGIGVLVWVPMTVLFTSYFDAAKSARMLTILNSCNMAGVMLSAAVVIPVVEAGGIRAAFLLSAAAAVIPIVISFTLKEQPSYSRPLTFAELMQVGRMKWVLALSVMSLLCHIMVFAASSGFSPQLALALGAPGSLLALIQLISTAAGMVFSLLSSKLFVQRFGARNSLLVLLVVQAVFTMIQPLMPTLGLLYVVVAVDGAARGTCLSLFLGLVVMPFHYSRKSVAMGFYQAIYSIGIVLGPTLSGLVADLAGINVAFYTIGALGLLAPLLGMLFLPDERTALPDDPLGAIKPSTTID